MKMSITSLLSRLLLILMISVCSSGIERTIDEQTARKLVDEALPAIGETHGSVDVGPWRYYWAPEFYNFTISHPGKGVLITHYLSVNSWTGDVWDGMACKKLVTPELTKEQEVIWERSGIPSEARSTLSARSPAGCAAHMGTGRAVKQ